MWDKPPNGDGVETRRIVEGALRCSVRPAALAGLLALGQLSACNTPGSPIQGGAGALHAPATLDFGQVYQGAAVTASAALQNSGAGALFLTAAVAGDPQLSLAGAASVNLGPGANALVTALAAATLGPVAGQLTLTGDAEGAIQITATVIPDLACPPPGPCLLSHFDPQKGACVSLEANDGQACDDGDPCTTEKVCSAGLCKGVPVSCDDQNVCTVDYCQPGVGCQHLDESPSCNGSDPCQVYYCDPSNGCAASAAADGTPCAAQEPCVHANVCLNGSCTGLPVPDGTPCAPPLDPCATDGTCHSGECDSPTADALVPGDLLWQTVSAVYSDGDGGSTWEGPDAGLDASLGWRAAAASDPVGNLYLDDLQPPNPDGGSAGDLVSLDICGRERWRVPYTSSDQWTNGRHLLAPGVVISVGADQTLAGQSQGSRDHPLGLRPDGSKPA